MGAISSARSCGAEAAQIWGSNPRSWAHPAASPSLAREFRSAWREAAIGPLFLHASYMVNIASPNPEFRGRSIDLAVATVRLAESVGADGVVVHAGAGGAGTPRERAVEAAAGSLRAIVDRTSETRLLVELTAGGLGTVASNLSQAHELLDSAAPSARVGLCLDTCHLFAAGYELDTPAGVVGLFAELRRLGLARRLKLVHANDSKFGRGERRDSHDHVGQGRIGEAGFRAILSHPAVRRCPVICETPGRLEDHGRNIAVLRRLAGNTP